MAMLAYKCVDAVWISVNGGHLSLFTILLDFTLTNFVWMPVFCSNLVYKVCLHEDHCKDLKH